jgi:TonB family protein
MSESGTHRGSPWLGSVLIHAALVLALVAMSAPVARFRVQRRWTTLLAPSQVPAKPAQLAVSRRVRLIMPGHRRMIPSSHNPPAVLQTSVFEPPPDVSPPLLTQPKLELPQLDLPKLDLPRLDLYKLDLSKFDVPHMVPPPSPTIVKKAPTLGSFGQAVYAAPNNPAASHIETLGTFTGQLSAGSTRAQSQRAPAPAGFAETPGAAPLAHAAAPPVSLNRFNETDVPPAVHLPGPQPAKSTGLEILYKPRPEYTAEARRLRVEGDVSIEAVFEASGRIRVLRIVRGLGHGLDESAVTAAGAIRFRPAMKDGQTTDTVAMVHIQFQLVY